MVEKSSQLGSGQQPVQRTEMIDPADLDEEEPEVGDEGHADHMCMPVEHVGVMNINNKPMMPRISPQYLFEPKGDNEIPMSIRASVFEDLRQFNLDLSFKRKDTTIYAKNKEEFKTVGLDDFEAKLVIGRGSFGKVFLVQHRRNKTIYAMKTLRKD